MAVMDINNIMLKALKNYFKTLKRTGHVSEIDTYRLLLAVFIIDLHKEEYANYISDKDNNFLTGLLKCLSTQTCFIPYNPECLKTDPIKNFIEDTPIITTEEDIIRINMNNLVKIVNR